MYDPNYPANNSPATAVGMRTQLNGLNDKIEAQATQIALLTAQLASVNTQVAALMAQLLMMQASQVPVGGVIPWFKDIPGVPALPANFVECNGQVLNDPESSLNGELMPDINTGAQRFLRGGLTSGQVGGIDYFATAQADYSGIGSAQSFVTTDLSPGAVPLPPFITAVYVMRVK